ncbi:MAG: helix-turn-helix transcriptional regulator [Deltaproteobacteria bacterium]|nr:helix-turn-helix transcriptional regulator [Deltaproteobacteria bacterium]
MSRCAMQLRIVSRLHILRAEKRMTQEQLAREIGVTRATVAAIERGDYNPSLELAFRLARFFDRNIEAIFSVEEGER